MYGKKRITLEKEGRIVIQGSKRYSPIGYYISKDDGLHGAFLKYENKFDRKLDGDNAISFQGLTKASLKHMVEQIHQKDLI